MGRGGDSIGQERTGGGLEGEGVRQEGGVQRGTGVGRRGQE